MNLSVPSIPIHQLSCHSFAYLTKPITYWLCQSCDHTLLPLPNDFLSLTPISIPQPSTTLHTLLPLKHISSHPSSWSATPTAFCFRNNFSVARRYLRSSVSTVVSPLFALGNFSNHRWVFYTSFFFPLLCSVIYYLWKTSNATYKQLLTPIN